jgi:hypothetical protein
VHSMYMRDGCGPASTGRTGGASSFFSGSLSGQSPEPEPPAFRSARTPETTARPDPCTEAAGTLSTRLP